MIRLTPKEARALRALQTAAGERRSKYHAVPTVVDGMRFASKAEARRYGELKLLEKAGEIRALVMQPSYSLEVATGDTVRPARSGVVGIYRADFAYVDRAGQEIVEDVKGMATPLYRWKKKHIELQYGITIREIRYGRGSGR